LHLTDISTFNELDKLTVLDWKTNINAVLENEIQKERIKKITVMMLKILFFFGAFPVDGLFFPMGGAPPA